MIHTTGFFVILLGLISCELLDPNPGPKPGGGGGGGGGSIPVNTTVDVSIGAHLYAQYCSRCHGDSAQGTTVGHPLQGVTSIANFVRNGNGSMPAFPELSSADIQSIELFLARFSTPGLDTLTGPPLFKAICARCHGDTAQGIMGLGPPIQRATAIATIVRSGKNDMPGFTKLTDVQIASLEAFLNLVPFERTGKNLYVRYCAKCHGDNARGTPEYPQNIRRELEDIYEKVRRGEGRMPAFPELSTQDITLIRNYILTL